MEQEKLTELRNKAFQSKTKEEWDIVMNEIKLATENDESARDYLRKYCTSLLEKKKVYWEKYKQQSNKPKFTSVKNSFIFQDELAHALAEYIKVKTELMKKEKNLL